jgi:hypothetical protein
MLMEGDPFTLIEGMAIAAHAVGAAEGYIYIRSEYPDAVATMRVAIDIAYAREGNAPAPGSLPRGRADLHCGGRAHLDRRRPHRQPRLRQPARAVT